MMLLSPLFSSLRLCLVYFFLFFIFFAFHSVSCLRTKGGGGQTGKGGVAVRRRMSCIQYAHAHAEGISIYLLADPQDSGSSGLLPTAQEKKRNETKSKKSRCLAEWCFRCLAFCARSAEGGEGTHLHCFTILGDGGCVRNFFFLFDRHRATIVKSSYAPIYIHTL